MKTSNFRTSKSFLYVGNSRYETPEWGGVTRKDTLKTQRVRTPTPLSAIYRSSKKSQFGLFIVVFAGDFFNLLPKGKLPKISWVREQSRTELQNRYWDNSLEGYHTINTYYHLKLILKIPWLSSRLGGFCRLDMGLSSLSIAILDRLTSFGFLIPRIRNPKRRLTNTHKIVNNRVKH